MRERKCEREREMERGGGETDRQTDRERERERERERGIGKKSRIGCLTGSCGLMLTKKQVFLCKAYVFERNFLKASFFIENFGVAESLDS